MARAKDWVERVEYEDYVEYREVPVDKIIEASPWTYRLLETISTQIWQWNLHHNDP